MRKHTKQSFNIKIYKGFFNTKGYLEVETPLLSSTLIPESNLSIFETEHTHPFKSNKKAYLVPSPEVWLKRFLSKNPINIFEISKCFRNSEQSGRQHNPEFTMVEFYSMDFTHLDTLNLTKELLNYINSNYPDSKLPNKHLEMSMDEAFIKFAGFSLENNISKEQLKIRATELGIFTEESDDWESTFNRIFIDIVEPNLPKDVNLFLTNFPSNIQTLAKQIQDTPWAQRWELYINGIECGNCYTEESNPKLIKNYFLNEGEVKHSVDMDYYKIFETFPECSGGAIGIDRLIMGILGIEEIQGVILFPHHDNI
ncbi:hypothetical protein EW093_05750 [Thiospirochaeta perfilievii]|uniref:Aminoacyl-transfer RNA synthetases class-II family profile domain-containing protein n=1 Tax=Thiospirochaeta perfilievii TaxID=252967 RepID=A0A5C1QA59_9SPIO|nr:hypothetical protein EW093_05750 [Thiospirochaeta perfilievii]